jgi:hypothetical protein
VHEGRVRVHGRGGRTTGELPPKRRVKTMARAIILIAAFATERGRGV